MKSQTQGQTPQKENEVFSFIQALEALIQDLPKRSQEIIFSRFGINGKKSMTLEEIGKKYSITRERVRQVIREVFKKVKDRKEYSAYQVMFKSIAYAIGENSGIMEENDLLVSLAKENDQEKGAIRFFLECLDGISCQEIKGELRKSYVADGFDLNIWKKVKDVSKNELKNEGQPMKEKDFYQRVDLNIKEMEIGIKTFVHFLSAAEEIQKNNFNKWGLAVWKEINPKGTREKAFLVLKEFGKPLHFKDIAQEIDKHQLNKKKTHPQTVHNELIKDKKFVLVGRGMYALTEWGFKKGTVKDVIEEILTKSGKPLGREDVLAQVLKVRYVKKSTVIINLNNFFKKIDTGYTVKK